MALEKPDHPKLVLKSRLVEVQIHPVDALHLQRHVITKNVGHSAG